MDVLGTVFETYLRLLLLLSVSGDVAMSEERICMLDFMTVYANDFSMGENNLHGYGAYRSSEYSLKRALAKKAIKLLVLDHLVSVSATPDGFVFSITGEGIAFTDKFTSDYSEEYTEYAELVLAKTRDLSDNDITSMICQYTEEI